MVLSTDGWKVAWGRARVGRAGTLRAAARRSVTGFLRRQETVSLSVVLLQPTVAVTLLYMEREYSGVLGKKPNAVPE